MAKQKRLALRDEGEVTLTVDFTQRPRPPTLYRIVLPATESSQETTYNVRLEPSDDPDMMNMYLENGDFVGTISKPKPAT
jgi:uncharacterized protein (DUF58 family)